MTLKAEGDMVLGGETIALGQTLALLERIGTDRSLAGAAEALGLSYRTAWGRLQALEAALGQPLVVKTKGHGSVLTAFGAELRDALGTAMARLEVPLAEAGQVLQDRLARMLDAPKPALRLSASHDPLLMEWLAERTDPERRFEVTVAGSAVSVERLLAGGADLAGFHIGGLDGDAEPSPEPPFDQLFQPDGAFAVRALFRREQGFLLAAGNPLSIRSVADIATTRARFVNRQRGSGTRIWFDGLLRASGLPPTAIAGYGTEEFTHQAVAAVIASGAADAGMGVRAVADRFGLAFVPCGLETYYLGMRAGLAEDEGVTALVAGIRERSVRASGYQDGFA
ncbi:substrate-binding domain-containing protein [Azospirillum sp. SYSU D00513]|uniref:substrate-binding domain-containing protein n=1 Tax=Azospirillum sp. SYSU D00513 TaxID=2812561 RepID=UPI001A968572